jgi:murein DD-endopeptidase MepM/ murein hydrolase activator NlpD
MQLIWVSGPTSRVVALSITRRKVLTALVVMALGFLLLGGLFQLVGLRVAVEHVPALAQKMGGVASLQEQQRIEAQYSARLTALQQQLGHAVERLQQMEAGRQAFFSRVGLAALAQPLSRGTDARQGRGGPMRELPFWQADAAALSDRIADVTGSLDHLRRSVEEVDTAWSRQHMRLQALPLGLPIQRDFLLSSTFGVRSDPMTHLPSMHEGIDFVAPSGTPIVATAPGTVRVARENGAYGNMVEIAHAEGFATRYAHLKTISVQVGQTLRTGDRVGLLGNTGRSTGPHLHYEVLYRNQPMHPIHAVQRWSRF